jgi:flagellar biosynthetic protein FliR
MVELLYNLLSPDQFYHFVFVLLRVSVIVFLLPIFASVNLPTVWKAAFALLLTLLLSQVVPRQPFEVGTGVEILVTLCGELLLGLVIGLSVRLILTSFEMGGQFMGFQMGYTIVNVVDPQSGSQTSIMAQFSYILAVLIFLMINGHHYLIQALVRSFELVPPGGFVPHAGVFSKLVKLSSHMFTVALKIAAPVMSALLLATIALGIVSKTVPQMNILIVGFPLNIGIGLLLFGVSMSTVVPYVIRLLGQLLPVMERLMQAGS